MSAYKKLNRQDVYVSDYSARKQWVASGSLLTTYKIETLRGFSGSTPGYPYPSDYRNNRYEKLVYDSINHGYYADGVGNGLFSGSRDLSLQSTLTLSGSRDIKTEVGVISIPRNVFGTFVVPKTFEFKPLFQENFDEYIIDGYCQDRMTGEDQFIEDINYWYDSNPIDTADYVANESTYVTESISPGADYQYTDIDRGQQRVEIVDDGNGALIFSGSEAYYTEPRKVIGDIIYNQGLAIITDTDIARYLSTYSRHILRWKSNQPIYTYNVHCKVKDSEMNYTYNPSAQSGSDGVVASNVTGSMFSPYVTTVGLYNDANELIAIAKTNRPIQKTQNSDMTFVVKLDL
jgi:hypothetical protein